MGVMPRPYADPVEIITAPVPAQSPFIPTDAKIVVGAVAPASPDPSRSSCSPASNTGCANGGTPRPTRSTGDSNADGPRTTATTTNSRECPVCGTPFPASTGRGRPRIYCGGKCRWRAAHIVEAEQRRQRRAERAEWTLDDLMRWVDTTDFPDPC